MECVVTLSVVGLGVAIGLTTTVFSLANIFVNGQPATVVGVMTRQFSAPY